MSKHNPVAKAINYMFKKDRWEAFTRFLEDGRVCLTNNCQRRLNFPQKCRSKIPHSGGSDNQPSSGLAPPFLGGRPRCFGGGGVMRALARTCSGMRSAWARSL